MKPILVQLDVMGLHPSILLLPAQSLNEWTETPASIINELIILLKTCSQPQFCEFSIETLLSPENIGVPEGSPIAPLTAEVFIETFLTLRGSHESYVLVFKSHSVLSSVNLKILKNKIQLRPVS